MSVVRSYTLERGRSPNPDAKAKPLAPALKQQCDQEKQELTRLNDRLAAYIERIKFLEGSNKKLQEELDNERKNWGDETRRIIEKNEPELDKARNKVDELSRDTAKAQIKAKRNDYHNNDLKRKHDDEASQNIQNKNKIRNLENLLEQNRNELDLLRNRVNEKVNEIDKHKKENEHLNHELNDLLNNLDDEQLRCAQLRSENQTLEEQIPFLNAVHEQEINEMKALSTGANINPAQFYRHELERAIRDIRNDFEQLNELERREMDEWYKIKTEEIKQLAAKRDPVDDPSINELVINCRDTVKTNTDEIHKLNQINNDLAQQLNKLHDKLDDLRRKVVDDLEDKDRNIADAKAKLNDALNDYDKLLHNKTSIEFEINTYKRLLESDKKLPPSEPTITSDELMQRLNRERAKTGDIRVALAWDNINDLDLHVIEPSGEEISFSHRKSSSGGELDIDMNAGSQRNDKPVENIYWPSGKAPHGHYKAVIVYYSNHGGRDPTNYLALAEFYGKKQEFRGKMTYGEKPHIFEFDV